VTPRRDRWTDFDRPYAPPVAVEGGVRVAKPRAVRSQAAARLVGHELTPELAAMTSAPRDAQEGGR